MTEAQTQLDLVFKKNLFYLKNIFKSHQSILIEGYDKNILEHSILKSLQQEFCLNQTESSCESCIACQKITSGQFEFVKNLIPEAQFYKVSQFRELGSFFQRQTQNQRWLWVAEAHKMNKETANAFLKTLEEPPPNLKIVLSSSNKNLILQTILSRSIQVTLSCLGPENFKDPTTASLALYDSSKLLNQKEYQDEQFKVESELAKIKNQIFLDYRSWGYDKEEFIDFLKKTLHLNHLHITGRKANTHKLKLMSSDKILDFISNLNKNADPKITFEFFLRELR